MTEINCPECGESALIGLPIDATVETIGTEPPKEPEESPLTKTRPVVCSSEHNVNVTFTVTEPDEELYRF
jgi:hypothetical protein